MIDIKYDDMVNSEAVNVKKIKELEDLMEMYNIPGQPSEEPKSVGHQEILTTIGESSKDIVQQVRASLVANDTNMQKCVKDVGTGVKLLRDKVEIKVAALESTINTGFKLGLPTPNYTIPKLADCDAVEQLKTKIDLGFKDLKASIKAECDSNCDKILKEVRKVAHQTGVDICGVCDAVGHRGRDCPSLDLTNWCRICGNSYHITKNCKEDKKKCGRCGKRDHHATMLHDETDMRKRLTLIQEFGDLFEHFVQV